MYDRSKILRTLDENYIIDIKDPEIVEAENEFGYLVNLPNSTVKLAVYMSEMPIPFGKVFNFNCGNNTLTTLKNSPLNVETNYFCGKNPYLTSLEFSPLEVGIVFSCWSSSVTSLQGCPDGARSVVASDCPLEDLIGLPKSLANLLTITYREELPLLRLIETTYYVKINNAPDEVTEILEIGKQSRKNIPLRQAIIKCQKELIDAGFRGNARL